jgi:hypothetical protein
LPVGPSAAAAEKEDAAMGQAEAWEKLARRLDAFRPEQAAQEGSNPGEAAERHSAGDQSSMIQPPAARLKPYPDAFRAEDRAFLQPAEAAAEREEAYEVEMDGPDTGLSGLRKLLLSPGLKGVSQAGPLAARGAETARPQQETPAQPVPPRSYTPFPGGPAAEDRSAAAPTQESQSPKASFESEEAEHAWADGDNARRDRRDPVDEVQILPSWRGQYKKKK